MNKRVEIYKNFIDGLAKIRICILRKWIKGNGWPKLPENEEINKFLSELSQNQKETLADIVQQARDGGIHDVLSYINDEINMNNLRIYKNNVEFAIEPYGTEMHYDWVCRANGDNWPEEQLSDEYK